MQLYDFFSFLLDCHSIQPTVYDLRKISFPSILNSVMTSFAISRHITIQKAELEYFLNLYIRSFCKLMELPDFFSYRYVPKEYP